MENDIMLGVSGLCKNFKTPSGEMRAVDNVSFDIKKGEVFGLVGESGCGKTTLGRTLIKIYPASQGEVYLDGRLIIGKRLSKRQNSRIAKEIQMIFQDPSSSLNPRMTVGEIIAEGLIINGEKNRRIIHERVCEMLSLVGLSKSYLGRYPHEFSGGQRQRIGIARALIVEPKLLIADEPISALDVSVQAQVINLLENLKDTLGLTVLFIAHDLSVVKYFSDRIGVMYKGKILELSDAEELFRDPIHPYTRALLSAIPQPDPIYEKHRQRLIYTPSGAGIGELREISQGHFVAEDKI